MKTTKPIPVITYPVTDEVLNQLIAERYAYEITNLLRIVRKHAAYCAARIAENRFPQYNSPTEMWGHGLIVSERADRHWTAHLVEYNAFHRLIASRSKPGSK